MTRPINSSEPYDFAVSISVMPKRNACTQRFFFLSSRVSALCKTRRALAQCWDDGTLAKLYASSRAIGGHTSSCINGRCA